MREETRVVLEMLNAVLQPNQVAVLDLGTATTGPLCLVVTLVRAPR